ncbi:MAG: porphobilinogen synthase [Puniceicoccaceae bacterium]|nr:MAG: porphobilinogen synthase [Puniceicoccaceae bacterium]
MTHANPPHDFKLELPCRPRRLRRSAALRRALEETVLTPAHLVAPLFVHDGPGGAEPVASMPGVERIPLSAVGETCRSLERLGLAGVALFPVLEARLKDAGGSAALDPDGLVLRAIREAKAAAPGFPVITDVALDPYTDHGHDGLLNESGTEVLNDATVAVLVKMAVLQAEAGADLVAPSDMMDGRVGAIRGALDAAGFTGAGILAYTAKFASAYYGPFREAVGSAAAAGTTLLDKRGYQLNPANRREALREAALDEAEAADLLMVKPAGPYLDIIRDLRERTDLPLAAYQVSGEYSQIHAAARLGWLDLERCRDESLLAIRRAGADLILTYFARAYAEARG